MSLEKIMFRFLFICVNERGMRRQYTYSMQFANCCLLHCRDSRFYFNSYLRTFLAILCSRKSVDNACVRATNYPFVKLMEIVESVQKGRVRQTRARVVFK